jgi:hypothetical protein
MTIFYYIAIYSGSIFYYLVRMSQTLKPAKKKNPAAVALGRLGGLTGGKSRMAKLSAKGRSELGRKAVTARWQKYREQHKSLKTGILKRS